MKNLLFTLILIAFAFVSKGQVIVSDGIGAWENATTWIRNGVNSNPTGGDTIIIKTGDSVYVNTPNAQIAGPDSVILLINGTLYFTQASKLALPCGSKVIIAPPGRLNSFSEAGESSRIRICNQTVWSADDGPVTQAFIFSWPPLMVLPVELISFTGQSKADAGVILKWTTASELNNSHFTIERSTNSAEFSKIGTVGGAGNSNTRINYEFPDRNAPYGHVYYRLVQTDYDGSESVSELIVVENTNTADQILVYPNPVTSAGELKVSLSSTDETGTIAIHDLFGRVIYNTTVSGTTEHFISLPSLSIQPGRYTVWYISGRHILQSPLIITR